MANKIGDFYNKYETLILYTILFLLPLYKIDVNFNSQSMYLLLMIGIIGISYVKIKDKNRDIMKELSVMKILIICNIFSLALFILRTIN